VKISNGKREFIIVAALLLLAFLVRLIFFSNQGFAKTDTLDFNSWFQTAANGGIRAFYTNAGWCDYPPFNVYFFWGFGLLAKNLGVFGSAAFTYVMKLPPNLFDLATATIIFLFARKYVSFKWSLVAMAFYAFNPAVIYDSALWGQFDAIYTFFLVLSLFLVFRSKPKLAVVAFMLGILLKPQSIALAPLFFFLIWRKADWKGILTSIGVAAATVFAVILPFEWSNPVTFLSNMYFGAYSTYKFTTLNAFNIWGFGGMWVPDSTATFLFGWIAFGAAAVFALYLLNKRLKANWELMALVGAFLLFFAFFMLPTRIHERYMFPAIAILALMFPFLKKTRPLYIVLTATCLINQAYVLSFLNAGTFIGQGDLVVFFVSLANTIALMYILILMIGELKGRNYLKPTVDLHVEPEETAPPVTMAPPRPLSPEDLDTTEKVTLKMHITKRDILTVAILATIFLAMATYNLGYNQTPVTQTNLVAEQSFYVNLGSNSSVGSLYFLTYDGTYNISVYSGTPQNWQTVITNRSISDYYKWNDVSISKTTQYIRIDVISSTDGKVEELAVSNPSSQQIPITSITSLNGSATGLQNLVDEQDRVYMPFTYMTQTYFDEIYFVRTAQQYLHLQSPYEWTHPPLGKLIQAGGIVVFGFSPFGWRLMGVIFGALMIPVMFFLGKKLLGSWIGGFTAAFLLTFDFMHFTMARMGTADTFVVFFTLLSQLCFVVYFFNVVKKGWHKTSITPLFLAVIFFFLSFSTKWLALYGAAGMLMLLVVIRLKELSKVKASFGRKYAAFFDYPFMKLILFIVLGIGIYFAIYIPDMLTGRPFIGTYGNGVVDLQFAMYHYHSTLTATHPFSSLWYSWPLMVGTHGYVPLWLDVTYGLPNSTISTISVFGNPAVWWVGFLFMIVLIERAFRLTELAKWFKFQAVRFSLCIERALRHVSKKQAKLVTAKNEAVGSDEFPLGEGQVLTQSAESATDQTPVEEQTPPVSEEPQEPAAPEATSTAEPAAVPIAARMSGRKWDLAAVFIAVTFLFSWLPYVLLTRVTFIYHYYESVPLIILASAYFVDKYWSTRKGKAAAIAFFAIVIAMFILFYPVTSGMPTSTSWIHDLKWFPSWYFAP
jgi:dolichyl-phosphate-mannose-protein mannosyltransferase